MKFRHNKLRIFQYALVVFAGLVFSACSEENTVVPKTLEQYKADLSQIVSSEKAVVQSAVVGYNKGDFRTGSLFKEYRDDYMKVLLDADSVFAIPDVTIADIVAANEALANPGEAFNNEIFISDRRPLQEVIVISDTLRVHTPVGSDPGMASLEAHLQFDAAIADAKTVRGASTTIDRQVTAATDELNLELDIFEDAIVK